MRKFVVRILKEASAGFAYKMLRKKNIVLNGKKASGDEILSEGDRVTFYLSDETFAKFAGTQVSAQAEPAVKRADFFLPVIYEDENILLYNKPVGVLSQKAERSDYSANEYFIDYLLESGQLTGQELAVLKPSVCNRLDRNTSGLLICGKTMAGLKAMNRMLKERSVRKDYQCMVLGTVREGFALHGYLHKDERTNKVTVHKEPAEGTQEIHTELTPLKAFRISLEGRSIELSLLSIHLITGKPHQIRAHLASIGHPIVGDYKYGNRPVNDVFKRSYGIASQLLHAYRLQFPVLDGELASLSGKEFIAPLPDTFALLLEQACNEKR